MIEPIMQGDAYDIPIIIKVDGEAVTDQTATVVEVCIGDVVKKTPDVNYSADAGAWVIRLTQADTFAMPVGMIGCQTRVKLANSDDVIGCQLPPVPVTRSKSREVL